VQTFILAFQWPVAIKLQQQLDWADVFHS
jgi:hypothetical protein